MGLRIPGFNRNQEDQTSLDVSLWGDGVFMKQVEPRWW